MNNKHIKGFTLIEIMIVVVIISILSAVAFPAYRNSVMKSTRSDAKSAVTQAAAMEERYYTQTVPNSYTNDMTKIGTILSDGKNYDISVDMTTGVAGCQVGGLFYCYTITATARTSQQDDTNCKTLSIDHTGKKTSTNSSDAVSTGCW